MLKQALLWFFVAEISVGSAVKMTVSNVSSSRDRVVLSTHDSPQRIRCPDQDRKPEIEKAWYGLSNITDTLDCRWDSI